MIENPDFENIRLISVKEFDFYTTHYSGNASKFKLYTFERSSSDFILLLVGFIASSIYDLFNNNRFEVPLILALITLVYTIYHFIRSNSSDIEIDTIRMEIDISSKYWFGKYFYKKTQVDFSEVNKIDSIEIKKGKLKLRRIRLHTNKTNRTFIDLHESQDYNLFIASLENIIIKQKYKPNIVYQTN